MKYGDAEENYNRECGERLKRCREYRKLTQEDLAKKTNYTANYISMLERGDRAIDWDKAVAFADAMKVSADFIMGQSEIIHVGMGKVCRDPFFSVRDGYFIEFLTAAGHEIIFHVIRLFDGRKPEVKTVHGHSFNDWDSLQIETTLDSLEEFSLSDYHCKLRSGDMLSEVIIRSVTLDGIRMSFGRFVFLINRFYDYIDFTLLNLKDSEEDYCTQSAQDACIEEELKGSRYQKDGVHHDKEYLQDFIHQMEMQYGKGSVQILTEEEKTSKE